MKGVAGMKGVAQLKQKKLCTAHWRPVSPASHSCHQVIDSNHLLSPSVACVTCDGLYTVLLLFRSREKSWAIGSTSHRCCRAGLFFTSEESIYEDGMKSIGAWYVMHVKFYVLVSALRYIPQLQYFGST